MTSLIETRARQRAEVIALASGITRWVEISCALDDLAGWVRPDTDPASTFDLISAEDGERLTLVGELFHLQTP